MVFVVRGKNGADDSFFRSREEANLNNRFTSELGDSLDSKSIDNIAYKEKIGIAITSIIASLALTFSKFVMAFLTNSLGMLSEGMHSGLDVFAALMTLYAVRMSRKPPDPEHNYGYAKFESLTSLGAVLLLFLVAGWIFYEGIERILYTHEAPEVTWISFGVLAASIAVDYGRSRALYRVANKYGSQAIEADALHFRVDMLTSSVVLCGLLIVYFGNVPNADSFAAIAVAGLIVYTSLGLGRRTLDVLLDKAPKGIQGQIHESITGFEGIRKAHSIRVRKVGKHTFVDLHIEVPRIYTHDKAHKIATNVENKIRNEILPESDVVVHVDAIEDEMTETMKDKIRLISEEFPSIKNIHSIYFSNMGAPSIKNNKQESVKTLGRMQQLHLYLDVQMDDKLDFKIAHSVVDDFEIKIKDEISNIVRITTHIETDLDAESALGQEESADQSFLDRVKEIALSIKGVSDCNEISLVYVKSELHITLTIKINPRDLSSDYKSKVGYDNFEKDTTIDFSVERAHAISTQVQNLLIENTSASRVIVHAEPA